MVVPAYTSMEWSECGVNSSSNSNNQQHEAPHGNSSNSNGAPTIKNHSVTYFNEHLYCFGGYDGRRNHNALLLYSLPHRRWIRPLHHHDEVTEQAAAPARKQQQQSASRSRKRQ